MQQENRNVTNDKVILNLIQDLRRLLLRNNTTSSVRGKFQIKFGMTPLWNKTGFTLIELLVVVLIIGILAAIAVPQYQRSVRKARMTEATVYLKNLYSAQELYRLEHGSYAVDFSALDIKL